MSIDVFKDEKWKDIEDFPHYQVSDYGRVRNKDTKYIMAQLKNSGGYMTIRLRKNYGDAHKPAASVHRLVAEAFLGGKHPDLQVNHKDGNKTNNHVDNLEWCTRKENAQHAMRLGLFKPQAPEGPKRRVRIVETDEIFDTIRDCANYLDVAEQHIWSCLNGYRSTRKGFHFEYVDEKPPRNIIKFKGEPLLRDCQMDAVEKLENGKILCGGVGSGKSRTSLAYYFTQNGGQIVDNFVPMNKKPQDLYIISTARKRDTCEWQSEFGPFLLTDNPEVAYYDHKVVIDSWNNVAKYTDVENAFFIFAEQRVVGYGAWTKAFLKITKKNNWILLSATPGDKFEDYLPVFIANGFYRNKTEFIREHVIYSRYIKYKIDRYLNTDKLHRLINSLLVDIKVERHTVPHHEDILCSYDMLKYKDAIRNRWDPYKDEPIEQAAGLCYVLRRIVNSDESRQVALLELYEKHPKMIVFYSFDYERDILLNMYFGEDVEVAEWTGHKHQPVPTGKKWIYLVQYTAGAEGWNNVTTDTMVFFSQNYSYKVMEQARGRIDRLNSPFIDLYYYHLKSKSGIDLAISKALKEKKKFNERKFTGWDS